MARGYLELGDHLGANVELERIRPTLRARPRVLEARWHVYERAAKWDGCLEIANILLKYAPDAPDPWLHRSYPCTRKRIPITFSGVYRIDILSSANDYCR